MQCSVIIPCHGGADLTRACLDSLLRQTGGHELQIVLVDNKNEPATQALAALHPCIEVLPQERNLGFAGGVNRGLAAARLPFLLVLNNDTQAAPHLLTRLHRALAGDAAIAFAAPVSNHVKGEARILVGNRGATHEGRLAIERELAAEAGFVQDVRTLAGLCLLLRRTTLDRLGPLDERFGFGNYEDDDWCLRARMLGHRLVVARDAFLHHEGHRTFQSLGLDLGTELARRRAQFVAKWQDDPVGDAALTAEQDLAAAAPKAEAARRRCPEWHDADWILGRHFAAQRQHAVAAAHFEAFLRACPNHTEARMLLGMCWLELSEFARVDRLWQESLAHCHFEPSQAAQMMQLLGEHARKRGLLDCAIANFETAVALTPDDPVQHNWLGIALLEARRFPEAIRALEQAAARGHALAHTNLGICWFQLGDNEQALRHFAAASALLPGDATAQHNLARASAALGRSAPATGPRP